MAARFIGGLELVRAYKFVQRDCEKFPVPSGKARFVRGSTERAPPHFWYERLYLTEATQPEPKPRDISLRSTTKKVMPVGAAEAAAPAAPQDGVPVEAFLVPLRGIADFKFLQTAVETCEKMRNYDLLQSPTLDCLIQFKWEAFVSGLFFRDAMLFFLLIVAFSAQAVLSPESFTRDPAVDPVLFYLGFVPLPFVAGLWLWFLRHELRTVGMRGSLWAHVCGDLWDALDVVTLGGMLAVVVTQLAELAIGIYGRGAPLSVAEDFPASSILAALALPVAWFTSLFFMLGYEQSGKLIRMVLEISYGIRWFLIVLLATLSGFAFSFYALYQAGTGTVELPEVGPYEVSDGVFGYDSPYSAMLTGFGLMLGDFDMQEFGGSVNPSLTAALFVLFMVLVNIVYLNLLIAIMGDTFDEVQESAKAQYLYSLAKIILEYEEVLPPDVRSKNTQWFPEYLQVLVPQSAGGARAAAEEEWPGRMQALSRRMRDVVKEEVGNANQDVRAVREEVNDIKGDVAQVKSDVAALSSKLDKLLELFADDAAKKKNRKKKS
uniref:Ion transport domain-containing protein n=1 Tax=Phaeomonas parva TaxID=124430 RepID=A0A7S1XMJ4_9STRA